MGSDMGYINCDQIPYSILNNAIDDIKHYCISFGVDDHPSGSGTLVSINGVDGILTAHRSDSGDKFSVGKGPAIRDEEANRGAGI